MEIAAVQRHPKSLHHPLAPLVSTQCGGSKHHAGILRPKLGYQQPCCRCRNPVAPRIRVEAPAKLDGSIYMDTWLCMDPADGAIVTSQFDNEVSIGIIKRQPPLDDTLSLLKRRAAMREWEYEKANYPKLLRVLPVGDLPKERDAAPPDVTT